MAQQLTRLSNQSLRILSALCLIPAVITIINLGSPYFDLLAILITGMLIKEWSSMSLSTSTNPFPYIISSLTLGILYLDLSLKKYLQYLFGVVAVFSLFYLGAVCWANPKRISRHFHPQKEADFKEVADLPQESCPVLQEKKTQMDGEGASAQNPDQRHPFKSFILHLLGTLYIAWSLYLILYFIQEGLTLYFIWILSVVWACDTGAYFVGKKIGGPKLAPTISPNKTWSGFIGGILAAMLVGTTLGYYLQDLYPHWQQMAAVSFYFSLMSHLGDLLESIVKRYFNVKDSGCAIP